MRNLLSLNKAYLSASPLCRGHLASHVIEELQADWALSLEDDLSPVRSPHRPEAFVLRPIKPAEAHARIGWVDLQIERRHLDGLLSVASPASEAVDKRVGDAEVHYSASSISTNLSLFCVTRTARTITDRFTMGPITSSTAS